MRCCLLSITHDARTRSAGVKKFHSPRKRCGSVAVRLNLAGVILRRFTKPHLDATTTARERTTTTSDERAPSVCVRALRLAMN